MSDTVVTKESGGAGAQTLLGRLFSFAVAGGAGAIVDLGLLRIGISFFDLSPYIARIPAIALAMLTTWFINRNFTFGASERSVQQEGMRYFAVAIAAAVLNYAIYSIILVVTPDWFLPEAATIIAVGFVTFFSYFGYSKLVFKR